MTETCLPIVNWLKNWFTSTDDLLDKTYPVGAIYMSVNNTSPSTLFGGTWQKIQGRFLLASGTTSGEDPSVDNTYTLGDTDGSKDAVVVSHNHTQNAHSHVPSNGRGFLTAPNGSTWAELQGANVSGSGYHYIATSKTSNYDVKLEASGSTTATNKSTGVSGANKNMPPYLVVNVWKRTA